MTVTSAIRDRGGEIVDESQYEETTRLSVVGVSLNDLYDIRQTYSRVTNVGVRGRHFIVDLS
jgi:hypothetical protein